jgi:hypothetical protein
LACIAENKNAGYASGKLARSVSPARSARALVGGVINAADTVPATTAAKRCSVPPNHHEFVVGLCQPGVVEEHPQPERAAEFLRHRADRLATRIRDGPNARAAIQIGGRFAHQSCDNPQRMAALR